MAVPREAVCAEIGVWRGEFAAAILRATRPTKMHLIDPWRFEDDPRYRAAWYGGVRAKDQEDMDRIFREVLTRFEDEMKRGRVEIHRATSKDAAEGFLPGYLDWVYIDGNHTYDCVKEDLETYDRKVRAGGLITGDDYGNPGWWDDGVRRAVDRFAAERRYDLRVLSGQFVLQKR